MTDEPQKLLSTTDARVWAAEFMKLVTKRPDSYPEGTQIVCVDESLMLTWFANAIEVGRREGAQAYCPHTARFDITEDLEACRACGKLFEDADDN